MLFASGLYSERARRATKTPPEGGVGVGSDLYNGVSRSNDRQTYTTVKQGIHDPECREVLSHNGVSRNYGRRSCKAPGYRIRAAKPYPGNASCIRALLGARMTRDKNPSRGRGWGGVRFV